MTGSPDLVDVNYKIEEGPSAQLVGGIGYSETYKLQLNGNYADANFLGTGQRVAVELNGGAFSKVYSLQHTNPYTTHRQRAADESLTYRDVTQFVSSSSNFSSKTLSLGPTWSYPITEFQYLRFGAAFESCAAAHQLLSSALQAQQWVQQNGHPYSRLAHDDTTNNEYVFYGTNFKDVRAGRRLGLGLRATARCSPTAACAQTVSVLIHRPGRATVKYWMANYSFLQYVPICGTGFTLSFMRGVDYGQPVRQHHRHPAVSASSSAAARTPCAASARAASGRGTSSATPTAATCASRARTSSSCRCRRSGAAPPG